MSSVTDRSLGVSSFQARSHQFQPVSSILGICLSFQTTVRKPKRKISWNQRRIQKRKRKGFCREQTTLIFPPPSVDNIMYTRLAELLRDLDAWWRGPGLELGGDQPRQEQEHDEAGAAGPGRHGHQPGVRGEQQQPHPARHRQDRHQHELWVYSSFILVLFNLFQWPLILF